jgi:phage repressor protein C with HTH and peptisase S24 domain
MEAYEIINSILDEKQINKRELINKINSIIGDNIPEQTIYSYLNGKRKIPLELRIPIAKALGEPLSAVFQDKATIDLLKEYIKTPTNELKTLIISEYANFDDVVSLPVFEAVAGCGAEGYLEQLTYSENKVEIDKKILPENFKAKDTAIIRIVGDSMSPYLEENDWAIIQLRKGNIVLADSVYLIAHGQNVQIKSCQFQADGSCKLLSINTIYPPIIAETGDWDIIGKVVARLKVGSLFQVR